MINHQRMASDPAASVWVAASAGTGKTKVLTDRVLRLLLADTPPQRLLCLTFTKAAAAEMAVRLDRSLGAWTWMSDARLSTELEELTGEAPDHDRMRLARRLFARVLDTPGGLKIQTIHAFCQSLLGRFPLEAGLAPHFQVADERTAAELLDSARTRALAGAGGDGDLAAALDAVAALVDESRFGEMMAALTRERGRLERMLRGPEGHRRAVAELRRRLGLGEGESGDTIRAAAAAEGAFDRAALAAAAAAMRQGGKSDSERGAAIEDWLALKPPQRAAGLDAYLAAFFTGHGWGDIRKTLIYKAALEIAPGADAALAAEAARLDIVRDRLKTVAVAESTTALLRLGARLLAAYDEEKRRHALLDYDDLVLRARDLLWRPGIAPWVLYKLDGGLDHILLDEGQDTNPEQWQVVAALAEEFFAGEGARELSRTVFAVGDAKQSIYSFQRADPDVYGRMREHFARRVTAAEQPWRPVDLVRSYRSVPAVLEAVDRVFADAQARDGLFSERIRHEAHRLGEGGRVELWPLETPEPVEAGPWSAPLRQRLDASPASRLARRIAGRIRGWLDSGEVLEARGRPLRPGDVMILVQQRNPFVPEMVRACKLRGIPVAGADRMVLTDQLAVMDLVALGHALLLPEDDLTLAAVLKGPLPGFDENELFALAYGRGRRTLWETLKRRRREHEAFARAYAELAELSARADFAPPYEVYAEVLERRDGRRRLVARLGPEANDPIDEFLALALAYERSHAPSLQGFLHWLEAGQAEVKRDMEQRRDEVRVITVHGAKGLQAPIVFLPDTCRTPGKDEALLWLPGVDDRGAETVLWPVRREREDALCEAAREAARARRRQEYHRLLYVAMTRAEDRLYVSGWEGKQGRREGCWYDLVARALDQAGEAVELGEGRLGRRLLSPQTAPPRDDGEARADADVEAPLPDWARRPPPPEPALPTPLAPSRPAGEEPPVRSPLGADEGAGLRRGRLVHRLLEVLPELPPRRRAAAARRYLANPVHGLSAGERREIARETLAVLGDAAFAALFAPGSRAEVPFTGVVGGRVVAGQVDRLCVDDEEVLVVDYKSNRPPPATPAEVPPAYLGQMAAYRSVLRLVYPGRKVRCALLWTDGARLMELPDEALDAAAP